MLHCVKDLYCVVLLHRAVFYIVFLLLYTALLHSVELINTVLLLYAVLFYSVLRLTKLLERTASRLAKEKS